MKLKFNELNHLQIGRLGEYWVKMLFTSYNLDTYYSDVDDKAIDFVIRLDNAKHVDAQVKTIRTSKTNYVFVTKESWKENEMSRDNLYLALVLLTDDQYPQIFLIPGSAWLNPNSLLCDRKYQQNGKKSKDEWGVNISVKNMPLLEAYRVDEQIEKIKLLKGIT
ncbi:hypothetical protein ASE92_06525 [Pedobacter sp. Leaf41]|uniref:hypothetical protein n=1 Tax=Pedobacter sp. Leaf41 TaxID=1736218 RepID=UPI000702CAC8|nr:hypothetical protein [Pedobacter sp. Leaf41]KQN35796.1 hypothetical protein ASE92_06525 [Pedobacter sp. Leaf41]